MVAFNGLVSLKILKKKAKIMLKDNNFYFHKLRGRLLEFLGFLKMRILTFLR